MTRAGKSIVAGSRLAAIFDLLALSFQSSLDIDTPRPIAVPVDV